MEKSKTHIYLIPGMGANTKIFEYIKLPENDYVMHFIEWELPERKESLSDYAFRMTKKITHENSLNELENDIKLLENKAAKDKK